MMRWASLGLSILLGVLLGILGFSLWDTPAIPVQSVTWSQEASWIGSAKPSYVFYARNNFYLPNQINNAWLRLSADNDFILYVNGKVIANEQSVLNNSSGLAEKISDPIQRLNETIPYNAVSGPHTLIANTQDWKLTFYTDIAPYLQPGKNTIALEIQKGQIDPRFVAEGWVETGSGDRISLTTGIANWRVSHLAETRQKIQWYELEFPDQNWSAAPILSSVNETTYSRVSENLFSQNIQGHWLSGQESPQGEVWLRKTWQVSSNQKRAFLRFAGDGEFDLLINGVLANSFPTHRKATLYLSDFTNLIHPGTNTIVVHLNRPLDIDKSIFRQQPLKFFLDGWIEDKNQQIVNQISTNNSWESSSSPSEQWFEGKGQGEDVFIHRLANSQEFNHQFIGDISLFNYPRYILHLIAWVLFTSIFYIGLTLLIGRLWLQKKLQIRDNNQALNKSQFPHSHPESNSLVYGTAILLPTNLYLIGVSFLKHRYAEVERGLFFIQPYSH
ncbi:MAG: glycosyl transferase, partial [Sphaerospermopsis sp. SIO1G2]|nr:glycosyl transferase [Sphaerospermopsis sp. SIO1G2]